MWTYRQKLGELYDAQGERVGTGYSGHGDGVNDPRFQEEPNVGPLPRGHWRFNEPRTVPKLGEYVLPLTPAATTQTFGRSGFCCHGDEIAHPGEHLASNGCLVLARAIREHIWTSGDHDLEVVA